MKKLLLITCALLQSVAYAAEPMNRSQVIQRLKGEYNVSILTDEAGILTDESLLFLLEYFNELNDKGVNFPILIKTSTEVGPEKVHQDKRPSGNILTFSKDAFQSLEGVRHEEISKYIRENNSKECEEASGDPNNNFFATFEFNHTLFEQLLNKIGNRNSLARFIEAKFGVQVSEIKDPRTESHTQDFSLDELTFIAKVLQDLPEEVRSRHGIQKIVRGLDSIRYDMDGDGIPDPYYYDKDSKTLLLTDGVFRGQSKEVTDFAISAGIGQAVWENLDPVAQGAFAHVLQGGKYKDLFPSELMAAESEKVVKLGSSGATDVALEALNLDPLLKESFSILLGQYVVDGEGLKKKYPEVHSMMKRQVFGQTEYFQKVDEKAKIEIASEHPDTMSPVMELPWKDALKFTIKTNQNGEKKYCFKVTGIVDDLSGIKSGVFTLVSRDNGYRVLCMPIFLEDHPGILNGKVYEEDDEYLSEHSYINGTYQLSYDLKDYAGNSFSGDVPRKEWSYNITDGYEPQSDLKNKIIKEADLLDLSKITVTPNDTERSLSVHLPVSREVKEGLNFVSFDLIGEKSGEKVDFNVSGRDFETKDTYSLRLPNWFPEDEYRIERISFFPKDGYEISGLSEGRFNDRLLQKDHLKAAIRTPAKDTTAPEIFPNTLELSEVKFANSEKGSTNIRVRIKAKGIDKGKAIMSVDIRKPNGDTLSEYFHLGSDDSGLREETVNGEKFYVLDFPLKPNHLPGTYELINLSLLENYEDIDYMLVHRQKADFNFIERGIRKTIQVDRD